MHKLFLVFTLISALFFAVSCDSGLKFDNPLENNPDANNQGNSDAEMQDEDSNEQTDTDPTDNESEDTEPDNPDSTPEQPDNGDSEPDNNETDDSDSAPDNADTTPDDDTDTSDSTDDSGDSEPDETDTTDDGDTSAPDEDADEPDEEPATRTETCSGLPANASWHNGSSITQTFDGNDWYPPATGFYSETAVTNECGFKCNQGYNWNSDWGKCFIRPAFGNICTGQINCYDNGNEIACPTSASTDFYGQDAQYAKLGYCYPQSFTLKTVSGNKVVVDNNTGLVWEQSPSSSEYTWENRNTHCNELNSSNYAGINTWRVPTSLELLTIIDNNIYNPAINSNFINIPTENSTFLWTSQQYLDDSSKAYRLSPYYGNFYYESKTKTYKVLCVHGNTTPKGSFTSKTINGKVVVTDLTTGLIWQKEYLTDKTWLEALQHCKDSTYAGYSDWRLPNKNELASLLNNDKSNAPYSDFPDIPSGYFWSSSTSLANISVAWTLNLSMGYVNGDNKPNAHDLMCVRSERINDPCENHTCGSVAHSSGVCVPENAFEYSCACDSGYLWNGEECVKPLALGNICTGQTKCYNASTSITCPTSTSADFYGQDAQYAKLGYCYPQSFTLKTVSGNKIVVDNNTGLVWEQSPSSSEYTWDDRTTHCNELNSSNYGGINTWRVPNPLELLTIVNNSTSNPATNSNFTGMPTSDSTFWTSEEYGDNGRSFSSYYGYVNSASKSSTKQVLCVSGNEMPKGVFTTQTISSKVVVNDSTTGLIWQKEYATDKTWQQALKYCEDLSYAGYTDWRLPNKHELSSLLNYEKSDSPYSYFPDLPSKYFWSSSPDSSTHAWGIGFGNGYVGYGNYNYTTNKYSVRCVR